MEISKINIDELKEYENNAKIHTPEQIEQIKNSILEFGNNDPIAIDENNVIIEGHGRLVALKELGYKEVEVIRLSHLTDEQKRAYMLIHNKLTMNTDFDKDILIEELKSIESIDMKDFDFDFDFEIEEDVPDELELDREEMGSSKQIKSLKYGNININMTEDEAERFEDFYSNFVDENGNIFGLVTELLNNGGSNYES